MQQPLVKRRGKRRQYWSSLSLPSLFHQASKREKLIFTTLSVTACVLLTAFTALPLWLPLFLLTDVITACLVLFSLWPDLGDIRYFFIPLFPILFTDAFLLNLLVIPIPPLLKFLIIALFGITIYLILLIVNIFNIAAVRTIPLMRAAHAANFSLAIVIIFMTLFFSITLKVHPLLLAAITGIEVFLPTFYLLWSLKLDRVVSRALLLRTFAVVLIIMQIALVLTAWPTSPLFSTLFLTTIFYVCVGVIQQAQLNRLQPKLVAEYLAVLLFTFCLLLINTQWGG